MAVDKKKEAGLTAALLGLAKASGVTIATVARVANAASAKDGGVDDEKPKRSTRAKTQPKAKAKAKAQPKAKAKAKAQPKTRTVKVPQFLKDMDDDGLVELVTIVCDVDEEKAASVSRAAIYKRLLKDCSVEDLQEAVEALQEDEDEADDDDDEDFENEDDEDEDFENEDDEDLEGEDDEGEDEYEDDGDGEDEYDDEDFEDDFEED